jgi:hypothetical protein
VLLASAFLGFPLCSAKRLTIEMLSLRVAYITAVASFAGRAAAAESGNDFSNNLFSDLAP